MDEIHVHKTKKSICAHFAESPCKLLYYLFLAGKLPSFLLFNKKHPKQAMTGFD